MHERAAHRHGAARGGQPEASHAEMLALNQAAGRVHDDAGAAMLERLDRLRRGEAIGRRASGVVAMEVNIYLYKYIQIYIYIYIYVYIYMCIARAQPAAAWRSYWAARERRRRHGGFIYTIYLCIYIYVYICICICVYDAGAAMLERLDWLRRGEVIGRRASGVVAMEGLSNNIYIYLFIYLFIYLNMYVSIYIYVYIYVYICVCVCERRRRYGG